MSIFVTSVKHNNNFRPTQDLNYLQANIDEPISVEIEFNYQDLVYSKASNIITFKPAASVVNLQSTDGIFYSQNQSAFIDYFVGDNIGISNAGVYTYGIVTEIFNGQYVRTDLTGSTYDLISTDFVFNCTPFAGLRYLFNLTDANDFNSLVDLEEQKLQLQSLDVDNLTPQNLVFSGAKSWQIGSATVVGVGGVGGKIGAVSGEYEKQPFVLTHNFQVTPPFLPGDHADLQAGIAPSYFQAQVCLNYIAELSLGRNLNNPNGLQTESAASNQSSTGWYDENFNGNPTNYSVKSLTMLDGVTVVTQPEFGKDITFEIVVENTVDSPFSSGNTQYMFGFKYLPDSDSQTQKTGFDMVRNFAIDYKLNTLGAGSVNGDNFGTNLQIIKTLTSTPISATEMKVTAVINTGTDADAILQQDGLYRYQIYLTTEDHTLSATVSDRVNLKVDVNEFFIQLTTPDLIEVVNNDFIQHPYTDQTNAETGSALGTFPVDDLVANLDFHINFTGHDPAENIKILSVKSELFLTDGVEEIILEDSGQLNVSTFAIVGGLAQNINFLQARVFKIPNEIRKNITFTRSFSLDSGDDLYYNYSYPFMLRWEYWEALGLLTPPADLFDPVAPNDGINHYWQRLTSIGLWALQYRVTFEIEQNAVIFEQSFTESIKDTTNYDGNTDWANNSLKSYDITTGLEIVNGSIKYLKGYEDVRIEAVFEKVSGGVPNLVDVGIVFWIEIKEVGGISDIRRASSFYELEQDSWFKSIGTTNKPVITKVGGIFTGEILVDYTKIPSGVDFTIYARMYEESVLVGKQFQNGDDFQFQDGTIYEFD